MTQLALFPLHLVLFPGLSLELQIFEQRYVRLVCESLRNNSPFGIVAITSGKDGGEIPEVAQIGTSVRISDWTQLDNGLLGISVRGEQRFEIKSSAPDSNNLIRAEIEWIEPDPQVHISDAYTGLCGLLADLAEHPGAATFKLDPHTLDAAQVGNQLAQMLPLEDAQKLELLAMRNPIDRLERLVDWVADLALR